jgi:hypothetical protein
VAIVLSSIWIGGYMPQRALTRESQEQIVIEELKSAFATAEGSSSVNEMQSRLDDFVKSRMGNPVWVENSIEKDLEAHNLRVKFGELSRHIREAKRTGDEENVLRLIREQTLVKEKLSKL